MLACVCSSKAARSVSSSEPNRSRDASDSAWLLRPPVQTHEASLSPSPSPSPSSSGSPTASSSSPDAPQPSLSASPSASPPSHPSSDDEEKSGDAYRQQRQCRAARALRAAGYVVRDEFAGGLLARVFKVRSVLNGRAFAAKCFPRDPDRRLLFERELHALQALRGLRGVVQLHRALQDEHHYYLLTQLAPTTLFRVVLRGPLKEQTAATITRSLCRTFVRLHALGWAHRDLKLENVVLDGLGRPKLIDFADSVQVRDEERLNVLVGTPQYLAPERWRRHTGAEVKASEVWALAVLVFEMLTAERCFRGADREETRARIERGAWSFPEGRSFSQEGRDFIVRGLTLDASERPTMAQMLCDPWLN